MIYLFVNLCDLLIHERWKNHLHFKGTFYFYTSSKIDISTPLTPKVSRLVTHN